MKNLPICELLEMLKNYWMNGVKSEQEKQYILGFANAIEKQADDDCYLAVDEWLDLIEQTF